MAISLLLDLEIENAKYTKDFFKSVYFYTCTRQIHNFCSVRKILQQTIGLGFSIEPIGSKIGT